MVKKMKQKNLGIGIVVLSLLFATFPLTGFSPVTAGPGQPWNVVDTFWGTPTNPIDVGPGDQNVPLSIVVQYLPEDPISATGISILLDLEQHFTTPAGGDPVNYPTVIGGGSLTDTETEFNPGDTGTVQFILNIKPNVIVGQPYPMELRVMYFENNVPMGGELEYQVDKVPLKVRVLGRPQLEVDFLDTTLLTEQATNIVIRIGNRGTAAANDVQVELTIPPPLIVTEGTTSWKMGQLAMDTTQDLTVPLYAPKISVTSTYQLVILLMYRDQNGMIRSETHYGGVVVHGDIAQPSNHLQVYFSVLNITAGNSNSVTLHVTNLGSNSVYDAKVGVELPPPLIVTGTDNQWQFEQILTQSPLEISMVIYAPESATGHTYPIVVTLAFKDHMGVDHIETRTLGMLAIGDIDLLVYDMVTFPIQIPIGGNFTVSGSILNRGNVEAMYTNVTIIEDTNFRVAASSTYYVGQIDPNAPIPFALTGFLKPDVGEGTYPLTIVVAYRDNIGGHYTLTTSLPVIVVPAEQGITTTTEQSVIQRITDTLFRPLPLLIIAIIIIIIWRRLRKSEEED